jgi:hypothetical protein
MAISRFLMNRQLRANGGIMDVTPRENFGLGSSLKKFVRKIIPNEVAEIATKAAPFVAPFNPLLAAGMSGIGTFDQTGSIGDSLKAGGMNYALGQGARYIGGGAQNLQTGFNPFSGYDASAGLTRGLLTNPVSDQGGLGKLFSNQGTDPVQGINSGRGGDSASALSRSTANVPGGAETITDAVINKTTVAKEPGFLKNMFDGISNQDYGKVAKTIGDGVKKFGKAAFYDKDGNIDRAAVMGAIAFAGSYIEALALADDAGIELTEGAYDEAQRAEKKAEYAGYLTNFFGGKKDGGRIGFKDGANKSIEEKIAELEFLTNKLMTEEGIQDRGYASKLASDIIGMKNESIDPNRLKFLNNESALSALPRDIRPEDEYYDTLKALENRAYGGRIGYGNGANEFMSEQMMLESNPGAAESGSPITIDTTMTGLINKYNTYKKSAPGVSEETRIFLKNDLLKSLEDAGISQEEFMMRLSEDTEMKANGGRIGYALGTPRDTTMFEELNADTIYQPDSTITLPNEMPGGDNRMPGDDRRVDKYDDYEFDQDQKTDSIRLLADFYMREEGMSESDAYEKAVGEIYDIQLKEGGRVGFNDGGSVITLMDGTIVQIPDGAHDSSGNLKDIIYSSSKGDLLREEIIRKLSFAKGGRVSRKLGSPEEGERSGVMEMLAVEVGAGGDEEENMMMADISFNSAEKSFLFKNLAKLGGADRSINMPKLYGILKNPNNPRNLEDARMLKAFIEIKMPGFKSGGRIGYVKGGNRVSELLITRAGILAKDPDADVSDIDGEIFQLTGKTFKSIGGISEIPTGQPRLNQGGVAERDYRETGGFVPVGIKERADDVPAMLSKNEFVMTADSVRGIGNGSVEEGSKKLYNTMKQAEQKGKIA